MPRALTLDHLYDFQTLDMNHAAQPKSPWPTFALVAVGVFMATLDSSIVNVSLPAIAQYFGVPLGAAVEWVVIAYLVCVAALLLTLGRLSDAVGRKRIWMAGLAVFTLGSMLCGAAPSLPVLIAARALQGIGGAGIMAISPAMLTAAFPPEQRGRAIGLNAVTVALGITTGPTLGGIITEHSSWRYIFYLNVPIGVLGLVATARLLAPQPRKAVQFDPLGALYLGVALSSFTAFVSMGSERGWGSAPVLALGAIAAVSGSLFALHERRHPNPVVDFALFRDRTFGFASLSLLLSFGASFAVAMLLPFYFEQLRGFHADKTGALLTPFPLTIAVIAPISGAWADRIGSRGLAITGMLMLASGLFLLSRIGADNTELDIILRLLLAGAGQALFQSPNNSALLGAAPRDRQGLASGILASGRVLGQSLSIAFAGTVFAALGGARAGRALMGGNAPPEGVGALQATFLSSLHAAFLVLVSLALCAAASAFAGGRRAR